MEEEQMLKNNKKYLKLLNIYNGDIDKAVSQLAQKQIQKDQRIQKKLEKFGLIEKNQKLFDMGYTNIKHNIRCLKLANNELDGAIQRLQKKQKQSESIPDLNSKVQELQAKGYKNYKRNQKILKKCNGNIEEAIKFLNNKVEKKELKQKVKQIAGQDEFTKEANEINYQGKTLYLDGNNILFTDDIIRSTYLKKNRQLGEKLLENLAIEFAKQQKLAKLILIFDGKGQKYQQDLEGLQFIRTFADNENFKISDDYLAKEANALQQEFKEECIFVTTDRELIDRILLSGCKFVTKSGSWMKATKEFLGQEQIEKILNIQ